VDWGGLQLWHTLGYQQLPARACVWLIDLDVVMLFEVPHSFCIGADCARAGAQMRMW